MGFDYVATEGEPKPRAPLAAGIGTTLGRVEQDEDLRQLNGRNARSCVAHHQIDGLTGRVMTQPDDDPPT